jgi:hypothetical protein
MKAVDPNGELVNTARAVGIRFGEETANHPLKVPDML